MTAMVEPPHKYLTLSSRYLFFFSRDSIGRLTRGVKNRSNEGASKHAGFRFRELPSEIVYMQTKIEAK